jgi:hypothetical protein
MLPMGMGAHKAARAAFGVLSCAWVYLRKWQMGMNVNAQQPTENGTSHFHTCKLHSISTITIAI